MDRKTLDRMLSRVQKPARYIGGEKGSIYKDKDNVKLRFAFCFPDTYDVGMSCQAVQILYSTLNASEDIWCERCFQPWFDMADQLRENGQKLFALESKDPLCDFDVVGFTLQYEMSFPGVLSMLDMGGIPLLREERSEEDPIVVAGGPCCCNPEPMADFIDLFFPGDGEFKDTEVCEYIISLKEQGKTRKEIIEACGKLDGVYAPCLYTVLYNEDGTIKAYEPQNGAAYPVKKTLVLDMDSSPWPTNPIVPSTQVIHDRPSIEVLRGCIRGCRFCQAGFIYRPFRSKDASVLCKQARDIIDNTGYDELSLLSLSTSDHPQLEQLLDGLLSWTVDRKVNLSLPSLRVDSFSDELAEKLRKVRESGLTFAAEAGTQRLRDVINKNITEEDILEGCREAFRNGYTSVKLYFMMGLPTETDEDVVAIAELCQRIVDEFYNMQDRPKGKSVQVTASVSCFIPKPMTPFQCCGYNGVEELRRKQKLLIDSKRSRKININYHDADTSYIEAVLAKGDRKVGKALLNVFRMGGSFEAWSEGFAFERWMKAFEQAEVDPDFYALRERDYSETEPWEVMDYGVSKAFLKHQWELARKAITTENCREKCAGCGINKFTGRECF